MGFNRTLGKIHLAANRLDGIALAQKLQYLTLTRSQVNL